MPPFLPRKRFRSPSPVAGPSQQNGDGRSKGKAVSTNPRKATLFDDLDAGTRSKRTAEHNKALLEKLAISDNEESSLSSLSEADFEDVPAAKRHKGNPISEDEDEDIEFEDVQTNPVPGPSAPPPSGDLELTLTKETRISLTNPHGTKKGPSKIERQIRIATHQVHVQSLMWHNAIRNSWLCDKELQGLLVKSLPPTFEKEIEKWRSDSGLQSKPEKKIEVKGKGKGKNIKGKKVDPRSQRDWGEPAERLAAGEVNMSRGDPLLRLLTLLTNYWKQRFRVTAPGLRKLGYMTLQRLDEETKSFTKGEYDVERHGERIRDIHEFRKCAQDLEGSRDVGAQLFTALLRALGLEARMVASLQPVGFGWSKNEEAAENNPRKQRKDKNGASIGLEADDDGSSESEEDPPAPKTVKNGPARSLPNKSTRRTKEPARRSSRGSGLRNVPIDVSDSGDLKMESSEDDDESIIDVTPARQRAKPSKPYDRDLLFPHYWTEVLSPVTNTYIAVDAVVLHIVAINAELVEKFEPRGQKSDKAKQVTAYIVGHSGDGTAKDVTTRYLKRHVWPGRTKGNRIPIEKVPVYNQRGKIHHHEEYDWFKTVMSGYVRGSRKCPRTEIDDNEEATILKVVKPEKKEVEDGKETLQSYKSSAEFVLERHLRREEALLPTASHVKMFAIKGKGDTITEEKVFLRKDVVNCKSMETWHKEGRAPIPGEPPMKRVPYRAATTNRKRELAEAEHASGEKMLQGLYSRDQTDWIIPPPIENGIIPKNNYGNMDVYVPSMVPEGAEHIPRRGTMRICKRLGIDFAEAVTGFEFGQRMAIPIITGVVVAEENVEAVLEEWEKDERERLRKEDEKRTKAAISMWRKMLMGMRIVERVREEYGDEVGDEVDVLNPWTNKKGKGVDRDVEVQRRVMEQREEEMAGGFLPEGHDEEDPDPHHSSAFFPVVPEDDDDHRGGFIVEGHDNEPLKPTKSQAYTTPQSLQSNTKLGTGQVVEEARVIRDSESEPEAGAAAPKKLGRPAGKSAKSKNKTPARPKPQAASKRSATQKRTPASRSKGKRSRKVADSEEEEDEGETSPLSEVESDSPSSELEEEMQKDRGTTRKAVTSTKAMEVPRRTPRRNAGRKSDMALKSHYFEHSDDGEDDE